MAEIDMEDLDRLHAAALDLSILTYLQGLVQFDIGCEMLGNTFDFQTAQENAKIYLWDLQVDVLARFQSALHRDAPSPEIEKAG